MRVKAKQIFLSLKEKNEILSKAFDEYVETLTSELEIPKQIAVTLVTDELVNKYEKDLILRDLFSRLTLDNIKNNHSR